MTQRDIENIAEAYRKIFYTKECLDVKFAATHARFSDLQKSLDRYAQKADAYLK